MPTTYEAVIGLEVHAQLATRTKLFCGCSTAPARYANQRVCPVCLGLPGALPVPNRRAVELAVRAALALGCDVQLESRFARKNYFYPDLPKGYQISQFELPLNLGGALDIDVDGQAKRVGITRIHIEEDAAKTVHGSGDARQSVVDFNRAGVPLIEIVGEPDLRSAAEAEAYLKKLREVLMFAGVNDGNLEEGSFRCDANVSLRPVGQQAFGVRTELKNINSFRFVRKAVDYEIARQEALLSAGEAVVQETRTWSEGQGKTLSMRSKEQAHDYRYFPDPDLPPLRVDAAQIHAIRAELPRSADARRTQWQQAEGLTAYDAQVLSTHPAIAAFFEASVAALRALAQAASGKKSLGKQVANFIQAEVLRDTKTQGTGASLPLEPERLAELLALVLDGTINGKIAKEVYTEMVATGRSPAAVVEAKGLSQVTDPARIATFAEEVLARHPKELARYREGKTNMLGFFVGQVMKATQGAANPKVVNQALRALLDGSAPEESSPDASAKVQT